MDWLVGLLGGIAGQAISAYFWAQTASFAVQALLIVSILATLLGLMWLIARQPRAGLAFVGILVAVSLFVTLSYRKPCPKPPTPFSGSPKVSSGWKVISKWDRYWADRHIPKAWKPYEALVRVRVGAHDLYIVFRQGQVYVLGEGLDVRVVEPTGVVLL